jgi:hypothetical protein
MDRNVIYLDAHRTAGPRRDPRQHAFRANVILAALIVCALFWAAIVALSAGYWTH